MNDMPDTVTVNEAFEVITTVSRADLTDAVREMALLADLTISLWSGERTDRALSEKIKSDAGAVGNTGRYLKNLLAGCDTELKAVRGAYAAARTLHYQLTLPWVSQAGGSDRQVGPRLLPNALFMRYLDEMGKLKNAAEAKRDAFVADYPDLVLRAQSNLAGMARPEDYPSPEGVRDAFRLVFDFLPIPAAASFVGLPDAMLDRLGAQLTRRQTRAMATAQQAMWERVRDAVGHLVDRLADPETVFKSSSIEAVRELVTLLPGWNCAGDPKVTTVVDHINDMLHGIDAAELRKDTRLRAVVASQAGQLASKLEQWRI
jgi:hypothetical protein